MNGIPSARRQRGAVLIVGMILLVVIMIVSLSGVRNVAFQEKMTSNTYDRGIAFQATEAALRAGEAAAEAQSKPPSGQLLNYGFNSSGVYPGPYHDSLDTNSICGNSPCQSGLCSQPDKDCAERWNDASFTGWVDASGLGLSSLAVTPQFIVEYLGANIPCNGDPGTGPQTCKLYRVTARSHDNSSTNANRSMVILQSLFRTE